MRDRLLLASAVALLVALLGGWPGGARSSRAACGGSRTRRERPRRGPATSSRCRSSSDDELGQLTRAFNEMQEQLARVDRRAREFIANASHELRTPIFSLGGFVELLQDEHLDQETRDEFLDTMGEQVERLQKLAVDLLDLSRLDAGSLELERERVDLAELAARGGGRVHARARASHAHRARAAAPEDERARPLRPGTGDPDHAYPA